MRSQTPLLIRQAYYGIQKVLPKSILKNKGFLRRPFWAGWTIGYSIRNGAILQFTKDSKNRDHFILNMWFFSFRKARRSVKSDGFRTWINFGWNQGIGFCKQRESYDDVLPL